MSLATAVLLLLMYTTSAAQQGTLSHEGEKITQQWIKQREQAGEFRFSVLIDSDENQNVTPSGLRVYDRRSGKLLQEFLHLEGGMLHLRPDQIVRLIDANFDGAVDVSLAMDTGGAGPNNTSSFYLYNRREKRFAFAARLSELTQIQFNKDKTISSSFRNGCCHHLESRYRYIQGRLTQIHSVDYRVVSDGEVAVTTGRLINGRMQYKTVTGADPRR